jgi:predicted MFS family arabinose efflux permease
MARTRPPWREWSWPSTRLAARYVVCVVLFGVAAQALLLVDSLPGLVAAGFVAGLAISPVLVSGMSLVESRVSRSALTEALTWVVTGLTLGVTAGSAIAGAAVDRWGAEAAFAVPAVGAAVSALVALAGAPLLRRPPRSARDGADPGRVEDRAAG